MYLPGISIGSFVAVAGVFCYYIDSLVDHYSTSLNFESSISKHCFILNQARVVQKADNTIHWIAWFVFLTLIHWIATYPYIEFSSLQTTGARHVKIDEVLRDIRIL